MRIRLNHWVIALILAAVCGLVFADNATIDSSLQTLPNTSPAPVDQGGVSDEALMNLALDAREYAMKNGKYAALSAFSDQASFVRGESHISAYDWRGVLLADPFQGSSIGTSFIADDHDTGIVRQLRDLAEGGGGRMKPAAGGNGTYYALAIDGSWWITAVSGSSAPNP